MKIDLGCGNNKQPGYVGIDRFETIDADIVCDMERSLPLEDNSVDYIIASHSLEHVNDIMKIMKEIYRICKHKALVCIVAPYYHTSLNLANPFHKVVFNEHTPRFFTINDFTCLDEEEYILPHARNWALGQSDNSSLEIDFRCLQMKFFYFEEYRRLSKEEKIQARKNKINVVDQILYQLLVVKENISDEEVEYISKNALYEEPLYIKIREKNEEFEDLEYMNKKNIEKLTSHLVEKEGLINLQINEIKKLNENNSLLQEQSNELKDLITKLKEDNSGLVCLNEKIKLESIVCNEQNDLLQNEVNRLLLVNKQEAVKYHDLNIQFNHEKNKIIEATENAIIKQESVKSIINENRMLKSSKVFKLKNRIRYIFMKNKYDICNYMNLKCKDLISDNLIQCSEDFNQYVVNNSDFLNQQDIIYYYVTIRENNWSGLELLMTNISMISYDKILGFEVIDKDNTILRTVFIHSRQIKNNDINKIEFNPILDSKNKTYIIRFVGLENIEGCGISLYEWQRYDFLGRKKEMKFLGKLIYLG